MSTLAKSPRFDDQTMWVALADGRVLGVPLTWFPRLLRASPAERDAYRISPSGQGLHWSSWTRISRFLACLLGGAT